MMDRRLRSESARSSFPASPEVSRPWLFQRGDYLSHMNLLMMSNYRGFLGDCMILHFLATYTEYIYIYTLYDIYIYTQPCMYYMYINISMCIVYPMYIQCIIWDQGSWQERILNFWDDRRSLEGSFDVEAPKRACPMHGAELVGWFPQSWGIPRMVGLQ